MTGFSHYDVSKSILGKLLAKEDITIKYDTVSGPQFDLKTRTLYIPMWKDISSDVYDLIIGHEVGHALYTDFDKWTEEAKKPNMKYCLNLVEDIRIEKKMKAKYPGLRRPMFNGYGELVEKYNFFGTKWEDMNLLPFLDRANLHFKLGVRANIMFNEEEQQIVDELETVMTWNDVVTMAQKIHKYAKKEHEEMQDLLENMDISFGEGVQQNSSDNSFEMDVPDFSSVGNSSDDSGGDFGEDESSASDDGLSSSEDGDESASSTANGMREEIVKKNIEKVKAAYAGGSAHSNSMKAAEEILQTLPTENSSKAPTYVYVQDVNYQDFIIPHAKVYAGREPWLKSESFAKEYGKFMTETNNYVAFMAREFELRKKAKQQKKIRIAKTGKLNEDVLWKYRLTEDLFLSKTVIADDKNHSMVMMLDMSSSMSRVFADTLRQTISLALFCKRVNIPFRVFGFTTAVSTDKTSKFAPDTVQICGRKTKFAMLELLSSDMRTSAYNTALKVLVKVATLYDSNNYYMIPDMFRLSGTPLQQALLVMASFLKDYKKNAEVTNFIMLTDGDGEFGALQVNNYSMWASNAFVIIDKKTKQQVSEAGQNFQELLVKYIRDVVGVRMFGMYLSDRLPAYKIGRLKGDRSLYMNDYKYTSEFIKNGSTKVDGTQCYTGYYYLNTQKLSIVDDIFEVNLKKYRPETAFKRAQAEKKKFRVFVNQFIEQIA